MRLQVHAAAAPHHDRRDDVAGARRVVVEQTEHGVRADQDTQLLVELAQRRVDHRLALVDATTGKRPLRGVAVEPCGPPAQQERGPAADVDHPPVEALRPAGDRPHRLGVERVRVDAVLAHGRVDDDDRDRRVPPLVEGEHPALCDGRGWR